jgi:hypothetical protein
MSFLKRTLQKAAESDADRLLAEVGEWAITVPGVVPLAAAPMRQRIRVAGVVRRIRVWPREGSEPEYLEAVITDGSRSADGDVVEIGATWIGRRSIPGLGLGTRLVVEGVIRQERTGGLTMDNPKFEFAL